jgi:hypothetical protein
MYEQGNKNKLCSIMLVIILVCSGFIIGFNSIQDSNLASAASSWTESSDTDFNNGIFEDIIINGTGDTADLMIDISGTNHWTNNTPVIRPTNYPDGRNGFDLAQIEGTDKVLLFGGWRFTGISNDTWYYDLSDNNWTAVQTPISPSSRGDQRMVTVHNDDKVVLFGGRETSVYKNDTWVFDLSDKTWTEKTPSKPSANNNPMIRFGHAMASFWGTDKAVLFSGKFGTLTHNDLWIFDVSDGAWTRRYPTGLKPTPRTYSRMATIYGTDKVMLYGGNKTNETWVYDLSDNNWAEMAKGPGGWYEHQVATIFGTDNVILFGGSTTSGYLNETWVYDYDTGSKGTWTEKTGIRSPYPRDNHGMSGVNGTDKVVLFGGAYDTFPWYNDETWVYENFLNTTNGTYISEPFDTGSNSSFDELTWEAVLPWDTFIKFRLRSAENESALIDLPFVGPDGSNDKYYVDETGSAIWSGHYRDRWVQYKAFFDKGTSKTSPKLKDVTISYNCLPEIIPNFPGNGYLVNTNQPTFKWTFSDFDSTVQRSFQVVIDDNIEFSSINYDSSEQFSVQEKWDFPKQTNYNELHEGGWYWKVRVTDEDGAWSEFSEPCVFTIDTKPPETVINLPMNNTFYRALDVITGTAVDYPGGTGVERIELSIKQWNNDLYWDGYDWVEIEYWVLAKGTYNWQYDSSLIAWDSGVLYNIQARAIDYTPNVEKPNSGVFFTIDTDSPKTIIDTELDDNWLNKLDIISGIAEDVSGAGINRVEISILKISANNYWSGSGWWEDEYWLTVEGTEHWHYNSSLVEWETDEQYIILARALDNLGNIEIPSLGKGFWFDDQPPIGLEIIINDDDEYATSNQTMLSLDAEDIGSGIAEIALSNDGSNWSTWVPFSTEKSYRLSSEDGEKRVYLHVRDYANNIAEPVFDEILMDTTPPEKVTIAINNDARFTNSDFITLGLYASDWTSGVDQMTFSLDGLSWQPWEEYKNTKSISVSPGEGEKKVYFKVSDNAGNMAIPISDTIILDTTPPEKLSITCKDEITVETTSVSLELSAEDALSGVEAMDFSFDKLNWSGWEEYASTKIYKLPSDQEVNKIYFCVKDLAGNVAEPVVVTLTIKGTSIDTDEDGSKDDSSDENLFTFMIGLIISIILMIILVLGFFILIRKRRRCAQEKALSTEPVTIKPNGNGYHSNHGYSQSPSGVQIPQTINGNHFPVQNVQIPTPIIPDKLAIPTNHQETPKVAPAHTPEPMPGVPERPQLPPAKVDENADGDIDNPTGVQPDPEEQPNFSFTPKQPTLASEHEPNATAKNGPNVHLPDNN